MNTLSSTIDPRKIFMTIVNFFVFFFISCGIAYADIGAGLMFGGVALFFVFIFISYLEALIYRQMLQVEKTLKASLFANFCTTGIGLLFYNTAVGRASMFSVILSIPAVAFLISFLLTIPIEYLGIRMFFSEVERGKLWKSVFVANIISYLVIVVPVFFFLEKASFVILTGGLICILFYNRAINRLVRFIVKFRIIVLAIFLILIVYIGIQQYKMRIFLSNLKGEVVYVHLDNDDYNIYKISANGRNKRFLYRNKNKFDSSCYCPRWSEDGSKIYFYAIKDEDYREFEMDSDGKNIRVREGQVKEPNIYNCPPAKTSNGKYSIGQAGWSTLLGSVLEIVVYDREKGKKVKITEGENPDWKF
jgi:hypothetical protein